MIGTKRGQEGASGAAGLVLFIGFIIIVYILAIPPENRNQLLEFNETNESGSSGNNITGNRTLLEESPGSLYPSAQKVFKHNLNQLALSASTEDTVLYKRPSAYILTSKLDKRTASIHFKLEQPENVKALLLSFNVDKAYGRLIVELNGEDIYNKQLKESDTPVIRLPTETITSENSIRIYASGVPWYAFWRKNVYELSDIKLIATIKRTETQSAVTTFRLSDAEVDEFKSGYIRFVTECTGSVKGLLKTYFNGRLMSSTVPSCMGIEKLDLVQSDLMPGRNQLRFELTEGLLFITALTVNIEIKTPKWPVYYFEVNSSVWDCLSNRNCEAFIRLEFVEESDSKQAEFTINGRKFYMDTKDDFYDKKITSYLRQGSNYIKITPETDLEVASLRVYIK